MLANPVRTLTWPEIEDFYDHLVSKSTWPIEPMCDFVRFVAASPYSKGLFPATSHEVLMLGRVANFQRGDNELQVRFDGNSQTFLFTYTQHPYETEPWSRQCDASEGVVTFERLLHKRLRWFHEG